MRSVNIATLMVLTAFLALNVGVLRLLIPPSMGADSRGLLLLGALPLLDALLIGIWVASRRCRFTFVRREQPKPMWFVIASGAILAILLAGIMITPSLVMNYVESAAEGIFSLFPPVKRYFDGGETVLRQIVVLPALVGLIVSGPPILFALVWGVGFGRYRLVMTPRDDP